MTYKSIPYTPNRMQLEEMTIALVTTAGVHMKSQTPFHGDIANPDISYRIIPGSTDSHELTVTNAAPPIYYDQSYPHSDINTVFPMDRLRELAKHGFIKSTSDHHYSFMGYLWRLTGLIEKTLPEFVKKIVHSPVDAVLLSAGSPYCHRTVVVIQRAIEAQGIPTVLVTLDPVKSGMFRPPRAIVPNPSLPFGASFGYPHDHTIQTKILKAALECLLIRQEPGVIHNFHFT